MSYASLRGQWYKAGMHEVRFRFLLNCRRFDAKQTWVVRKEKDKFAPIRGIWAEFIKSFIHPYKSGSYLTADEQLLVFWRKRPFRMYIMYIPNKPAKYGRKIEIISDVGMN